MAIRFRPQSDPSILFGFLLWLIGIAVIWLAIESLHSKSTATGVGALVVAVALLVLFVRIWRASERARWVAGIQTVLSFPGPFSFPDAWDVSWLSVHAFVLVAISVGLWRAQPWARWAAGGASTLAAIKIVRMWVNARTPDRNPTPLLSGEGILVLSLALFWAVIAVYLFLPSTGERFANRSPARGLAGEQTG